MPNMVTTQVNVIFIEDDCFVMIQASTLQENITQGRGKTVHVEWPDHLCGKSYKTYKKAIITTMKFTKINIQIESVFS